MRPVPEGLEPHLKAFLQDVRSALMQAQNPAQPQPACALLDADLPVASDWKNCVVNVTDKNCLAVSTEVGNDWLWVRADGSSI